MKKIIQTFLCLSIALLSINVFAQDKTYPSGTIKIIVPLPAGSGTDISARFYGEQLSQSLKVPVVVENKPGANSIIAVRSFLEAPADGYTLFLGTNTPISVNPIAVKNLPYNPDIDFKPIYGLAKWMSVYVVNKDSKFNSIKDVVDAAKEKTLSIGNYSTGYLLSLELFSNYAGIKFNPIPYKGAAQVLSDIIGGSLDIGITDLAGASQLITSGKVKALAVTGDNRHPDFPNVPTFAELGYPGYVIHSWNAIYVKSGTPTDIAQKLTDEIQRIIHSPAAANYLKTSNGEVMSYSPIRMVKFQEDEITRYRRIAKLINLKPE